MHANSTPAVGIDFGTSTILLASARGIVPIGHSSPWMPSLVGYDDDSLVVAEDALEIPEPERVIRSIKRCITERRSLIQVDTPSGTQDVHADDLMVELMREALRRGTSHGLDMTQGAIRLGCPAMWDGPQRRRLVEVMRRCGLTVTLADLVDEPVAAGISWLAGAEVDTSEPLRVLVFDMGGGTLDVAVLEVRGADVSVLSAVGSTDAGDTLDEAVAEDLDYLLAGQGIDVNALSNPRAARIHLNYAAREVKIGLTSATEFGAKLSKRLFGIGYLPYTRDQLNEVFSPQMDRAEQYVAAALRVARLTEQAPATAYDIARTSVDTLVENVDVVVLSGGMSRVPYVAERMRWFFPPATRVELASAEPEHAVALGLAKAGQYGRINMYRPAFDVVIEWEGGRHTQTIYEAFTPLVEPRQIIRGGSDLRFVRTGQDLLLPSAGEGRLRVVSYADAPFDARLGDAGLDGFPVVLSGQKFEFSIYPNGRIRMVDGAGTHEGRVDSWHTVRV